MKITKYPDGSSYVTKKSHEEYYKDSEVLVEDWMVQNYYDTTFRINSYEDLWHLGQYVDALNYRPNIVIPNLLDAQADRRFESGQSFGLKRVIEFLAELEANFTIFHPHNPEVVEMGFELLGNPVEIEDNTRFLEYCISEITDLQHGEDNELVLLAPDAGAYKSLAKVADKLQWDKPVWSASKSRTWDPEKGESVLTQVLPNEDFTGKDVIIVDDLCVYGGTFKGLSKKLKEAGARSLYLVVSHMTVQHLGYDAVGNYFTKVFTTDSKYDSYTEIFKSTIFGVITEPAINVEVVPYFERPINEK